MNCESFIFFSFLIINRQMAHSQKSDSSVSKDRNLILVAHNSELFPESHSLRSSSFAVPENRRNPSHDDLLPSFHHENRHTEEHTKRQEPLTDAQRYAQQCLQYEKYLFDDRVRLIIHRMAILAYHNFKDRKQHVFLTFFVERFLCALAKKLLLNRYQLLFLEYVFQESKWRYDIDIVSMCANEFKPFIHLPESECAQGLVNNLQVYLLFCAYYSKKSLNDISNEGIFNYFLRTVNEHFKERYQDWAQASAVTKIKINPKILNSIFRKLTSFQQKEKQYIDNYNLLVEEILEISPAYNAGKDSKGRKKKRKMEEDSRQIPMREQLSNNIEDIQPIQMHSEEEPEFPSLSFRKKQTSQADNLRVDNPLGYISRKRRFQHDG